MATDDNVAALHSHAGVEPDLPGIRGFYQRSERRVMKMLPRGEIDAGALWLGGASVPALVVTASLRSDCVSTGAIVSAAVVGTALWAAAGALGGQWIAGSADEQTGARRATLCALGAGIAWTVLVSVVAHCGHNPDSAVLPELGEVLAFSRSCLAVQVPGLWLAAFAGRRIVRGARGPTASSNESMLRTGGDAHCSYR